MAKNLYYPKWKQTGKPIHQDVAPKFYGRKVEEDEVIHHIDGDPSHFAKCNLVILKKKDHDILSKYMDENKKIHYPKFEHRNKKKNNKNIRKIDNSKICNNCNHENQETYSFCIKCGNKLV